MLSNIKNAATFLFVAASAIVVTAGPVDAEAAELGITPWPLMKRVDPKYNHIDGCTSLPGVVNGECIWCYSERDAKGLELIQQRANCNGGGECVQIKQGFKSMKSAGDGTYGTSCRAFSGDYCQGDTQLFYSGNVIAGSGDTHQPDNSNGTDITMYSYMCYFNC